MSTHGRNIKLNLGHIKIAQCTLEAIGYLSTWAYQTTSDRLMDAKQQYDTLSLHAVDSSQDIGAYFTSTDDVNREYFIMAVFDETTKTYGFHS